MLRSFIVFFFFNDTATTEIYTLSLHDALPISRTNQTACPQEAPVARLGIPTRGKLRPDAQIHPGGPHPRARQPSQTRSEEHTSELQSRLHLVCRLLLEKKKKK